MRADSTFSFWTDFAHSKHRNHRHHAHPPHRSHHRPAHLHRLCQSARMDGSHSNPRTTSRTRAHNGDSLQHHLPLPTQHPRKIRLRLHRRTRRSTSLRRLSISNDIRQRRHRAQQRSVRHLIRHPDLPILGTNQLDDPPHGRRSCLLRPKRRNLRTRTPRHHT